MELSQWFGETILLLKLKLMHKCYTIQDRTKLIMMTVGLMIKVRIYAGTQIQHHSHLLMSAQHPGTRKMPLIIMMTLKPVQV